MTKNKSRGPVSISINMPKKSSRISAKDIMIIPNTSGIYYLYNDRDELLYVGKAVNLRRRVRTHLLGRTNTSHFQNEISSARYFECLNLAELEIYETYIINTLYPIKNKSKVWVTEESSIDVLYHERRRIKWKGATPREQPRDIFSEEDLIMCLNVSGIVKKRANHLFLFNEVREIFPNFDIFAKGVKAELEDNGIRVTAQGLIFIKPLTRDLSNRINSTGQARA